MRKFLLLSSLLFSIICTQAQTTYTWGGASGDFDIASSWSPNRTSPAANDVLVFDGSLQSTATVTSLPIRETIGQLFIINNCTVTFSSATTVGGSGSIARTSGSGTVTGTGTSFTTNFIPGDVVSIGTTANDILTVTSATGLTTNLTTAVTAGTNYTINPRLTISTLGNSLSIAAGSSLTVNATTPICIYTAAGVTGSISGAVTFSGSSHRLIANDANAITFNSSSSFTQGTGFAGNAFCLTTTPTNAITFANGSTLTQSAGANAFGLGQPASKIVLNSGSLYIETTGTPSFSGRTYGNFQIGIGGSVSVIGGNPVSVNNLTVTGNTTLTWGMTGTPGHAIKGNITVNSGSALTFAPASAGTVNLNGTTAQTITAAGTFTIGNNATIVNGNIAGLIVAAGTNISIVTGGTFNVNANPLTLKSNATGTASIGTITGTLSNTSHVTVERYIPAHAARAYTMVGFSAFGGTIYNNWQEAGASTVGYGTQISGASTGSGFDFASAAGIASIYNYDDFDYPAGSKWQGLNNTNSTTPDPTAQGYLLFVRGDRTVGAGSGAPAATTLRSTGTLATGPVNMGLYLGANLYSLEANPYACAINWSTISKQQLTGSFTIYDPNLLSFVTSDGTTVSPNVSQQQANIIQSGQAFFIQNNGDGSNPSFLVNETDKNIAANTSTSNTVFGMEAPAVQLNVNCFKAGNAFADGAVAVFGNYSKNEDAKDAAKFTNFGETISFAENNNRSLSIDARPMPQASDTLFVSLKQMVANTVYSIVIDGTGFNSSNLQSATLIDAITGTHTTLDLSTKTSYSFTTTAAAEAGRLYIVLNSKPIVTVPPPAADSSNANALQVNILGNPVQDQLVLNYIAKQAGNTTIRLINANGQAVTNLSLGVQQQGTVTIPVAQYAGGLYLVEVTVGGNTVIAKVIRK